MNSATKIDTLTAAEIRDGLRAALTANDVDAIRYYGIEIARRDAEEKAQKAAFEAWKSSPLPGITERESKLLKAIYSSEYHDSNRGADRINNAVWVDCIWGFEGKKSFGGIMAGLTKKGLADTDGEGTWITRAGFELLKAEANFPG